MVFTIGPCRDTRQHILLLRRNKLQPRQRALPSARLPTPPKPLAGFKARPMKRAGWGITTGSLWAHEPADGSAEGIPADIQNCTGSNMFQAQGSRKSCSDAWRKSSSPGLCFTRPMIAGLAHCIAGCFMPLGAGPRCS